MGFALSVIFRVLGFAMILASCIPNFSAVPAPHLAVGAAFMLLPTIWRDIDRWLVIREGIKHSLEVDLRQQIVAEAYDRKNEASVLFKRLSGLESEINLMKMAKEDKQYSPFGS